MRRIGKILAILAGLVVLAAVAGLVYLKLSPPTLLRVGAGFSSKLVCSAEYVEGRNPATALASDVLSEGNPILHAFMLDSVAQGADRLVRSAFLQFIAPMTSVDRPGLGCVAVPDGNLARVEGRSLPPPPGPTKSTALWPEGSRVDLSGHPAVGALIGNASLAGPHMRAIVVVWKGRIIAERYAKGFTAATPQIGWSMAKTVTTALAGTVIAAGKLRLGQDNLLPEWAHDGRSKITVAELMSMTSGQRFNEDYGAVSDVTRMLYLQPDMARFAAGQPLLHKPGTVYHYSTGEAVILSRVWQNAIGNKAEALAWPRKTLFGPLGMGSAVFETDEAGTFVGGSNLYATPRDWARFGQFLLQDGVWNGKQILPKGFVQYMRTPSKANPAYGDGMVWMDGPAKVVKPGADLKYGVPKDAYWLWGYDHQTVTVVPSQNLVVVRMGLTPNSVDYKPQRLVGAIIKVLNQP